MLFLLLSSPFFLSCSAESKAIEKVEPKADMDENCCIASSTILFWRGDSIQFESELKSTLSELNIEFRDLSTQEFDATASTINGIRDTELSRLSNYNNTWSSLQLRHNSTLTEAICQKLSRKTQSPVIAILEYDESAWGYCLFDKGKIVDAFWNDHEIVEQSISDCTADLDLLAKVFNVTKNDFAPYLKDLSTTETSGKINPDDEFEIDDPWVRVDFMRKLGLIYPENGKWMFIIE